MKETSNPKKHIKIKNSTFTIKFMKNYDNFPSKFSLNDNGLRQW